ncbi:Uncharacterised protein [uncultured archaeon]|nr:Uncharacterised protein [uncultured archaeon]
MIAIFFFNLTTVINILLTGINCTFIFSDVHIIPFSAMNATNEVSHLLSFRRVLPKDSITSVFVNLFAI